MRIVDLSLPMQNVKGAPQAITYVDHREGATARAEEFGFDPSTLPAPGVHLATEQLAVATHRAATHVDAPWHYGPISGSGPARTIDELPLDWFVGRGVVLDCREVGERGEVTRDVIERAIEATGTTLRPADIPLIRTDSDTRWGSREYERAHPHVARAAMELVLDHGVRVVGIDAYSMDGRVVDRLESLRNGHHEEFMPIHMLGREREFAMVEKLGGLRLLPATDFLVLCLPVNVRGGSGGWCRAAALVPDHDGSPLGEWESLEFLLTTLRRA